MRIGGFMSEVNHGNANYAIRVAREFDPDEIQEVLDRITQALEPWDYDSSKQSYVGITLPVRHYRNRFAK